MPVCQFQHQRVDRNYICTELIVKDFILERK